MSGTTESGIVELLERAGAKPRGNRHDCPKCGGIRTVTHSEEVFYCHKCQWRGNTVTLEKELGIYRRIPSAEYRELRRTRERAEGAARELYERVKARRKELLDVLHDLNRLEGAAHDAGPTDSAWESLAQVYRDRPVIESKLDFLETASAAELVRSLN